MTRIFHTRDHFRPDPTKVERAVVTQSDQAVVVAWHLYPGQTIEPHRHPQGQDTWMVLAGRGDYLLGGGETHPIMAGDVVIAANGQPHGVRNTGTEPLQIIAVVAPAAAGFEPGED